jgi:flagellar operon protein
MFQTLIKEGNIVVIRNNLFNQVGKVQGAQATPVRQSPQATRESFGKILQEKLEEGSGLRFSKHAEIRMRARNIKLSQQQKEKISEAVKKAEVKGVKDSLVLIDDVALVVNIRNKTVITAANSDELKQNVFTNIDGAVII